MMMSDEEQVLQIKDLCRRRLLYIANCLENCRTMDLLPQVEEILTNLLQLSSFVSVEDSMICVEEALQTFLNNHDNPQQNTEDPLLWVVNSTREKKYEIPRETLEMLIYDGVKVKQIAELFNVSKRTVERRMHEREVFSVEMKTVLKKLY